MPKELGNQSARKREAKGSVAMSPRQKLFCKHYLVSLNATAAAKRAGYSEKTAHSQGPRLLENVAIKAEIARNMVKRAEKINMGADEVLRLLADEARDHENNSAADRIRSLELIGRRHRLFTDKIEHSGGLEIVRFGAILDEGE